MLTTDKTEQENTGHEIKADRPEPIVANMDVVAYDREMDVQLAIDALHAGYSVLIIDFYSSGLSVLNALRKHLKRKYKDQSFQGQRQFRSVFHELSHRVLLKISGHKPMVKKAPSIGWFEILYPDTTVFLLPFPDVQGLNSSWQWYVKGITIPVLKTKIYPWYGTYFPTRFEHLQIFEHWLLHYKGDKKSAIDVGVGCGALSFQMLNHGFEKVLGTDSNPNAIIGLKEAVDKHHPGLNLELIHGDLFADCQVKSELIVFNPPWLPASYELSGMDTAIYYEEGMFTRFFEEAKNHLLPEGKLVLIFSNLAQITGLSEIHPIEKELAEGGRFRKEYLVQKKVQSASHKTRRNQKWRASEMVELWVLKGIEN